MVDFEGPGETKGSYASGTVNLSGLDWDMTEVLIGGNEEGDWKNGERSARLRGYGTSSMTMFENKINGLGTISFLYRRYGTDTQVDWMVQYSIDTGVSWEQIGSVFIAPASDEVQTFSETVNIQGNIRIRIKRATETGTTNRRLNIDDITITDYIPEGYFPDLVIDFDDENKWKQGSGGITSYQIDHIYNDLQWEFTNGPALRQTNSEQDGFQGALGTYAWRLNNEDPTAWTATFQARAVLRSFGFKVRRWDGSPNPNWSVVYSTDGGENYSNALITINNNFLGDSSDWKSLYYILPQPTQVDCGDFVVMVFRNSGERIIIDDFSFAKDPYLNADWHYRSAGSGEWENTCTWEYSPDGINDWEPAYGFPEFHAPTIVIRPNDTLILKRNITSEILNISEGASLEYQAGTISITGEADPGILIEPRGLLHFNGGEIPSINDGGIVLINNGGKIKVSINKTGLSNAIAGKGGFGKYFFQSGAIFEWNTTSSFSTSVGNTEQIYFPSNESGIPIFRITANVNNVGSQYNTTINGIFEANGNITWERAGTKTFRNGIIGSGNVTQRADTLISGAFIINGNNAQMGGSGNLILNSNGLEISGEVDLISDKTVTGGPVTISGEFNAGEHTLSLGGDLIIESGAVFNEGTSNLVFNGPSTQILTLPPPNPHPVRFASLTVNNPAGVTINQDIQVINTLSMQAGNILNEGKTITVGESVDNVGNVVHSSGSIHGKLRRWISSSATDNLIFPVGKQGFEALTTIQYTTPPTFGGALTVEFIEEDMGLPPTPAITIAQTEDCPVFNIAYLSYQGFWKFEPEGFSGGTYDIAFNPKGLEIVNDLCQLTALKRTGNGPWTEAGTHVKPTGTITQPVIKRTGVTSGFSDWGIGGGIDNPLPIELLSFTAKYQDGIVLLNWATGSEINNDYFTLERSRDALNAEIIGFVDGAGNSSRTLHYQFVDRDPLPGISYYRLKQTDYDGSFEYSQWMAVQVDGIGGRLQALAISQPQGLLLRIFTPTERQLQIQLADIYGRIVHSQELSPGSPGHIETFVPMPQSARSVLLYRITDGLDVVTGKVVR